MTVEYENEDFPELLTKGCEEFLRAPVYQMMLQTIKKHRGRKAAQAAAPFL